MKVEHVSTQATNSGLWVTVRFKQPGPEKRTLVQIPWQDLVDDKFQEELYRFLARKLREAWCSDTPLPPWED